LNTLSLQVEVAAVEHGTLPTVVVAVVLVAIEQTRRASAVEVTPQLKLHLA
jgi:hypothetical protein